MASKRSSDVTDPVLIDDALEKLFQRILRNFAETDAFGRSTSTSFFIVYAHDSGTDKQGDAHAGVVHQLIKWLGSIRSRALSDKAPLPLWSTRESNVDSVHNILSNQFCLLPADESSGNGGEICSVDKVVVCGSHVLKRYYEDNFTTSYIEAIQASYHESRKSSPRSSEALQDGIRQIVETRCHDRGFHHVLTELAFLHLRSSQGMRNSIIPVALDGDLMSYLPLKDNSHLVVKLQAFDKDDLYHLFFKLLIQMYPSESNLISTFHDCYKKTKERMVSEGSITNDRATEIISQEILRTHKDLRQIENAAFRIRRHHSPPDNSPSPMVDDPRRMKFISELSTLAYFDRKNRNPKRVEGTCEWFLNHDLFRYWQESQSSRLLWVSADPGCGKSVLARHLVDNVLVNTKTRTVCYFFFKDDFTDQRNLEDALRCLLHQVFIQRRDLLTRGMLDKYETDKNFFKSYGNLWSTLLSVARSPSAGEIVCIIDALDECEETGRVQLINALNELYEQEESPFNLKFLLTSRPYVDIQRDFRVLEDLYPTIHLSGKGDTEAEQIAREIDIVIAARISELGTRLRLDANQKEFVRGELTRNPNRTYLWVHLVFADLGKMTGITRNGLQTRIRQLPKTVSKAYEKILSKSDDESKARRLLHIIVAAYKPLSLGQMASALAIEEHHRSSDNLEPEQADQLQDTIAALCGLLVTVSDSKLYLLHQTVKEFLVRDSSSTRPVSLEDTPVLTGWQHSLCSKASHLTLAEICIWHLGLDGARTGFWDYAAEAWMGHYREAQGTESENLMLKAEGLCCDSDARLTPFGNWIGHSPYDIQQLEGAAAIQLASFLGLVRVVRSLLGKGADIETQTYVEYRQTQTPLSCAAEEGHALVVKLLLKNGADTEARDKDGGTPLYTAAQAGNEAVVRLLLDKGADIEARDNYGETPLYTAARAGKEAVVRLLLDKGADIEARGKYGGTPLYIAARARNEAVVRLLLDKGADIEARDENGRTALSWAVAEGDASGPSVRALLEKGADVEARDENGRTPLLWALDQGPKAVFRLLDMVDAVRTTPSS